MHAVRWPGEEGSAALLDRAETLLAAPGPGRRVLGIAGPPAGGKSTLTDWLVATLTERHPGAVAHVGMDAFHHAQAVLARHDLVGVKGAPQTFDAYGYLALLERIRTAPEAVYAPIFHREIEDSIAHEAEIGAEVRLVVTEGNYLLLRRRPWQAVRSLLDECWYVHLDPHERRRRLIARHMSYGRSPEEAAERADGSDAANARLIAGTLPYADLLVDLSG